MPGLAIVPTGASNERSVIVALHRLRQSFRVATDAAAVEDAGQVILPGVGAFGPAAHMLHRTGVADAIRRRINENRPTLGICLGMQLLATSSAEAPGVPGIGGIACEVVPLEGLPRIPNMGWSYVQSNKDAVYLTDGWAYFAHSYAMATPPADWLASRAANGTFVAAVERGACLACQFHPELSGRWGEQILQRWLRCSAEQSAAGNVSEKWKEAGPWPRCV